MTAPVEVHVPTRVRTDPRALAADGGALVEEALAAASARALDRAADALSGLPGGRGRVVVHAPAVKWTGTGLAAVPAGIRTQVEQRVTRAQARSTARLEAPPSRRARGKQPQPTRPWRILKSVEFRARSGALTRLVEELGGEHGLSALHAERADEERRARLQVIEALAVVALDEVVAGVSTTLSKRAGERQLWAYTIYPGDRHRLAFLDSGGTLARDLPDLTVNLRRAVETPSGVLLGPGALIAFVSFSLPSVVAEGRIGAAPEAEIDVRLDELGFLIEPESFEAAFGVSWRSYAEEFGERRESLRLQAFFTKAPIPFGTLDQLVRTAVRSERVPSGSWFFGRTLLLTGEALAELPEPARAQLAPYAKEATRSLGPGAERGTWATGWDGAFVYAVLTPDPAESEQARGRALARARADELVALLQADRGELLWPYNILTFLRRHYRSADPASFELLLRELEARSWLDRMFDWIELEENGDLHWTLIDLAWRTSFARHARVTRSAELANKRRRDYLPHLYFADRQEIWLDRNPYRALRQFHRIDSIDTDYRSENVEKVLKPEAEAKLLEQVQKDAPQFIEDILTGKITEEFADMNALLMRMVEVAAAKVITEKDFQERTTERTLQLLKVERRVDPFERYFVTYEVFERVYTEDEDEDTVPFYLVPGARRTVSDVDFQWLVWGWEYHHEAARMEIYAFISLGISAAPLIVLGVVVAGVKVVAVSILLSELIYVGTTIWRGEKFTVEGFVMAAVDGYIGALGFRFGNVPAALLAKKIGAATTRHVIAGWVAEKTVTAMVGGAGSAAMMQFTHDLVNVSLHKGRFSSPEEYVRSMKWGLLLGFAIEAGAPALKVLFRSVGGEAVGAAVLNSTDDVIRAARQAGLSPAAWQAMMRDVHAAIRAKLAAGFKGTLAERLEQAMIARFNEVGKGLAEAYAAAPGVAVQARRLFLERVLEVSGAQVTRAATPGLLRYARLTQGVLDQEAAVALLRRLRGAGHADSFFRALAAVDDETATALARAGRLESLATRVPALDTLAQHRAFLENVGRAPPRAPGTGAGAVAGDLVAHPSYSNVLIDASLGADGFELLLAELRRTPHGEQIAEAIVEGRLHVLVHSDEIFAGYSGTQVGDEIFAQWTGSIEDTASTLMHEGSHWLDPNRFVPGLRQTGPGSSRLVLEATARAHEFELRRLQGLPAQDALEAAYRSEYDRVLAETGSEVAANRAADDAIVRGLRADPAHYGVETAAQEGRRLAAALEELDEALESSLAAPKPPPAPGKRLPDRQALLVQLNAIEWRHGATIETSTAAPALYDQLDAVRKFLQGGGDLAQGRLRVARLMALWRAEAELAQIRIGFTSHGAPPGSVQAAGALPVRTGVGGKKSIEGLRQVPALAPDAPALPLEQVTVTHRPFSSADDVARQAEILELHKTQPSEAGLEYERFVIAREGPPGVNLDRPGRRPDIGGSEITLAGMHGGLSAHKRQQLWLDLVDTRRVHLIMPEASELALFELGQLGHAAQELLGVSVSIEVVLTK